MLNIYIGEEFPQGLEYIQDVEDVSLVLSGTPAEKNLLKVIEGAKYLSPLTKRFGKI